MSTIEKYEREIEMIQEKIEELKSQCKEKRGFIKQNNIPLRELYLNKSDYFITGIELLGFVDGEDALNVAVNFEDGYYLRKVVSDFREVFP